MDYKEFAQQWVENLMKSVDALLDEETRVELMEACGPCPRGKGLPGEPGAVADHPGQVARRRGIRTARWGHRRGAVRRVPVRSGERRASQVVGHLLHLLPRLDERDVRDGRGQTRGRDPRRVGQARRPEVSIHDSVVRGLYQSRLSDPVVFTRSRGLSRAVRCGCRRRAVEVFTLGIVRHIERIVAL
jgi:hypothetical protein